MSFCYLTKIQPFDSSPLFTPLINGFNNCKSRRVLYECIRHCCVLLFSVAANTSYNSELQFFRFPNETDEDKYVVIVSFMAALYPTIPYNL